MSIHLPGARPASLTVLASFLIMYGPGKATYWLYYDGMLESMFFAYSSGTGTVIGITSACETSGALAVLSFRMSVVSSGVSMPEIGLMSPLLAFAGVPTIELK